MLRAATLLCPIALAGGCEPPPPEAVDAGPALVVEPPGCDFGEVEVGAVARCDLDVTNVGAERLTLSAATTGPPFAVIGVAGALLPAGETLGFFVQATPGVPGLAEGELAVGPGRVEVPLSVEGVEGGAGGE